MRPEDQLQKELVAHVRAFKHPGVVFWHTPNGAELGGRNKYAALNKLKSMGWLNGVSDLVFFYRKEAFCLELKVKGTASEEQGEFLSNMESQGAFCCVAIGLPQAICTLESWGLLRKAV